MYDCWHHCVLGTARKVPASQAGLYHRADAAHADDDGGRLLRCEHHMIGQLGTPFQEAFTVCTAGLRGNVVLESRERPVYAA